jgi:hypothetical protein
MEKFLTRSDESPITKDEFWRRVRVVDEYLSTSTTEPINTPYEIRWLLACAAIGEKHPAVCRYGKTCI